jgi:hypothetical protein
MNDTELGAAVRALVNQGEGKLVNVGIEETPAADGWPFPAKPTALPPTRYYTDVPTTDPDEVLDRARYSCAQDGHAHIGYADWNAKWDKLEAHRVTPDPVLTSAINGFQSWKKFFVLYMNGRFDVSDPFAAQTSPALLNGTFEDFVSEEATVRPNGGSLIPAQQ